MPPPMIATRATRRSRSICALLLLALAGCGGRSVRHYEDATPDAASAAGDDDDTSGARAPSTSKDCLNLCDTCGLDRLIGVSSCTDFCDEMDRQAVAAACSTLYDGLVRCRAVDQNACSLTACPAQTNAFSVCVLTYCDQYPSIKPLCTAW
jgi:hypothetical protein